MSGESFKKRVFLLKGRHVFLMVLIETRTLAVAGIYFGDGGQAFGQVFFGILKVFQFAGEIGVIGGKVKVAVTAEAEKNGFFCAGFTAFNGGADGAFNSVGRFRCWQDALGAGKEQSGFKDACLARCLCFNNTFVVELTDQRGITMITEAAGVNARGHKVVSQSVHFNQRGEGGSVAEVVGVLTAGQSGQADGSTAITRMSRPCILS